MFEYKINIARNGRHLFRVELGKDGDSSANNFETVFAELKERFPDCKVTASKRTLCWTSV